MPCLYDQGLQSESTERAGGAARKARRDAQIHMGDWDPMSCNNCFQTPGPPGISSWTKLRLGWLEPSKIRVVNPGETAQITLGPLEDASSQTMVIKIPVTDFLYYAISIFSNFFCFSDSLSFYLLSLFDYVALALL